MAIAERSASPPAITDQDWASESIWHSSFVCEPSGVPSSKKARRYQAPSHASRSIALQQPLGLVAIGRRSIVVAAGFDQGRKPLEHHGEEPAQPDAFALAVDADAVHAVVPIAAAHQRQAVCAEAKAVVDRPEAVAEQILRKRGDGGQLVALVFVRLQRQRMQVGDSFVEDVGVAGGGDVVAHDERQPEVVVGESRANAAAGRRMPPMLHVALLELARRGLQNHLPGDLRQTVDEGHHVLQLVAEAEGAARLIERRSPPDAATERLVQQPVVDEHVEGAVGRVDFDGGAGRSARTASVWSMAW